MSTEKNQKGRGFSITKIIFKNNLYKLCLFVCLVKENKKGHICLHERFFNNEKNI